MLVEQGNTICKSKDFVKSLFFGKFGKKLESTYPFMGKVCIFFHNRHGVDFAPLEMMVFGLIKNMEISPPTLRKTAS